MKTFAKRWIPDFAFVDIEADDTFIGVSTQIYFCAFILHSTQIGSFTFDKTWFTYKRPTGDVFA